MFGEQNGANAEGESLDAIFHDDSTKKFFSESLDNYAKTHKCCDLYMKGAFHNELQELVLLDFINNSFDGKVRSNFIS
jgi:hypothetical protein